MRPAFNTASIPEYHEGMLFVQARAGGFAPAAIAALAGSPAAPAAAFDAALGAPMSPGLAAISYFERAGLIKRVVPVGRDAVRQEGISAFEAFAPAGLGVAATMMAAGAAANDAAGGLSLIELERDEDRERVQLALANDPAILTVSRVPVRAIAAAKPRRRPARRPPPRA